MRKIVVLVIVFCLCLSILTGCETTSNIASSATETGNDTIDVDLTLLSSTMVFAEVYNMMVSPDDYVGKTIKMKGQYSSSYQAETEQYYHYIVITDAAGCCPQGIEFILNSEYVYPDDYPEVNAIVEIVGMLDTYDELGHTYYYLVADGFE